MSDAPVVNASPLIAFSVYELFVSYRSDDPRVPALRAVVNLLALRIRLFADWIQFPDRAPDNQRACEKAARESEYLLQLGRMLERSSSEFVAEEFVGFGEAGVRAKTRLIFEPRWPDSLDGEIQVAARGGLPDGRSPNDMTRQYGTPEEAAHILERLVRNELPAMDL